MSKDLDEVLGLSAGSLEFLGQFDASDVDRLQQFFAQAHVAQREQVDQAIEAGLQIVPKILRKTVRRIFGDR